MTVFVFFMMPETKGIPVERVPITFARHGAWRPLMGPAADAIIEQDATRTASRAAARAAHEAEVAKEHEGEEVKRHAAEEAKAHHTSA